MKRRAVILGRAYTGKPPGLLEEETGGFALAPQTSSMRKGNIVGAVEPGSAHLFPPSLAERGTPSLTRQLYTRVR